MRSRIIPILLLLGAAPAAAQDNEPLEAARAALAVCAAQVEGAQPGAAAKAAFEDARRLFRAAVAAQPTSADAHAGLGETLSRCGVPLASMVTIMNVVDESTAALEQALKLDPRHWQARFILAMNSYHMPAMMNRTGEAIRQLETLLAQQGAQNDRPGYALTYRFLGDALARAGRTADAARVYVAGARLFPGDAELQQRAADAGESDAMPATPMTTASPEVVALAPLRIDATSHQLDDARSGTSLKRLDIMTMPGGTGEMLQTLQTLPGATRAGDGADLYIRGGDPEETPVFLNGGRLPYPGRWEGLNGSSMGVLDANVLSRAYFSAGAFSAKYGNALSGVVDVESHGRPAEPRARIGANLVSAGGSMFRPVGAAAGAWGAFMLTDVSLVARMQGQRHTYRDIPQSYQLVAGGSVDPARGLELKAVALAAGDRSARVVDAGGYNGAFASAGASQHVALSGRWLDAGGRAGVSGSVTGSRRSGGFDFGVLARDRTDSAWGARLDGDVVSRSGSRLRGGVELVSLHAVTDGIVPLTGRLDPGSPARELDSERQQAAHVGGYVEAEHLLGDALLVVAGVRADRLPGEAGVTLDPRAGLAWTTGTWTLRAGAGLFHQGRWRRTWQLPQNGVPAGTATRAQHVVLGVERGGEPAVRAETYMKRYDRYAADDGGLDVKGGSARGLDAMVRWQRQARLNGWITYSLLDARLELLDGSTASARFDVTHTLTAVGRFALSDMWELGSTVRYATGKPYTPVTGTVPAATEGWPAEPVFGAAHSARLPEYFRVDGRITRYQELGSRMGVFYLEMLDLNGRRNIMGWQYDTTYSVKKPVESFFSRRTFVLGAEIQL